MTLRPEQLLAALIAFLLAVILSIVAAIVLRRESARRRYRALDRDRERFGREVREWIDGGGPPGGGAPFAFPPRSSRWHAVEEVLSALRAEERYAAAAASLFDSLGYGAHYERELSGRGAIARSSAAEKLGRMGCAGSAGRLAALLDGEDGEIVPVAVRALSKLGTAEALEAILRRLPALYARSAVSRRSVDGSLRNFGPAAVPELVRHGESYGDPAPRATVLEVLGLLGSPEGLPFAFRNLDHGDPDVRARALKAIGLAGFGLPPEEKDRLVPLLSDPAWFVRLQAARALGALRHGAAAPLLARRLADPSWQVRNAAATAVVATSVDATGIFLDTLSGTDRYAKESVCEEIQKTGFVDRLVGNLAEPGGEAFGRSREILSTMAALGYAAPLREYLEGGADEGIRRELAALLREAAP